MQLAAHPLEAPAARVRWAWLIPVSLFVLAVALYIHTANYELMTSWDDNRYIAENMLLRNFSLSGLKDIWTQVYFAAYIPVTITSYWLEFNLWGMAPAGYHVVNVLLNGLNSALVYIFLLKLLKNRNVALMATLLWIVHPLQVETVAWVAERKSLLAMLFTLLSFIAYMRSAEEGAPRWTLPASWILFFLATFAKPAVVGIPILFLFYDLFFARRVKFKVRVVDWHHRDAIVTAPLYFVLDNYIYILRIGIPIVIAILSAISIVLAHEGGGGIKTPWGGSRYTLNLLMLKVYWEYAVSFFMPWSLNNFYRYNSTQVPTDFGPYPYALANDPVSVVLGGLLLVSFVYVVWKQPFGRPFSAFAIVWIIALMLPVINVIPIAIERADRYMYFPSIVIFAAVAILIDRLWRRLNNPGARLVLAGAFTAIIVALTGVTYFRSLVWQSEGALWKDHLQVYPTSQTGWLNLGVYYYSNQDYNDALPVFQQLVKLNPADFKGNRFLGHIAIQQQRYADAIPYYRRALQTNPDDAGTYAALGLTYYRLEDWRAAITAYSEAIKRDSTLKNVYPNLGSAALRFGNYPLAEDALRKAVADNPKDANSISDLCTTLSQTQRVDEAIDYCLRAAQLQPNNGFYLGRLASLYLDSNQPDKALPVAQRAVSVAPNSTLAYRALGEAYAQLGEKDKAIAALQKSLTLDPGNRRARQILDTLTGS